MGKIEVKKFHLKTEMNSCSRKICLPYSYRATISRYVHLRKSRTPYFI